MNKEAWIIFRNGDHKLQVILKEGFGHVCLLYKDAFNWILVVPKEGQLEIVILPYKVDDDAPRWVAMSEEMEVLKVTYRDGTDNGLFPRFLVGFTCVSLVKYFIGFKDLSVTPWQLFKSLNKLKKNIIKVEIL